MREPFGSSLGAAIARKDNPFDSRLARRRTHVLDELVSLVNEVRQLEMGDGNRDDVASLLSEELRPAEMLFQLFANSATDDLSKAVNVGLDAGHDATRYRSLTSPRAKMLATKCSTSLAHESQ